MTAASHADVSGTLADVNNQLERSAEEVQEAELHVQSLLRRQAALVHALRLLQHKHLVSALQHTQLGFTQDGRPVASMVVHRCLLSWRALDVTDSATQALLQSIISVVTHALDENQLNKAANGGQPSPSTSPGRTASTDVTDEGAADEGSAQRVLALCAYWLTVTSVLLALLHRQVEEHASYFGSGKGSGSQRLGDDMGPSSRAPAAPTKLEEFQNKIANKFSMFRDNLLKRSGPSESKDPGATAGMGGTPRASVDVGGHGLVEPTPAQVFRHSLDLLLLQAYSGVRDSIKKQLAPLLPSCIQAPERVALPDVVSSSPARTKEQTEFEAEAEAARLAPADPGVRFTLDDSEEQQDRGPSGDGQPQDEAAALAAAAAQEQLAEALKGPPPPGPLHAWEELVAALQLALDELRAQCVPRILIKCVFKQLLGFVDSQLFNQLLLRPDCCCASNARHVLAGLKLLDQWVVAGAADAMMRPLYQELRHVRQAATFLVTPGKSKLSVEDITGSLCPALTAQQIYRLCTTCWDDAADTAIPQTPLAPAPTPTAAASEAITPAATPRAPPAAAPATANGEASAASIDGPQENQPEEDMVHVTRSDLAPLSHSGPLDSESRERLADLVSGEVLEDLKGAGGGLQGNGGLLITFLLDEWQAPIIAPEGCTAREVLGLIESKDLYGPLELPPEFDTPSCPRSVFAFLEEPLTVPPHLNK